eukprot:7391112-Prymnesium_polylepis.1
MGAGVSSGIQAGVVAASEAELKAALKDLNPQGKCALQAVLDGEEPAKIERAGLLGKLFASLDKDGSGQLDLDEFAAMGKTENDRQKLPLMFRYMDEQGDR